MTQGKETVTTYKIRIDTKRQKGTEWKIYGRKSVVKMQKTHWGGGGGRKHLIWQFEDCVCI